MSTPRPLDPAITSYYDRAPEESRLDSKTSALEAVRTRELIVRHAPAAPAVVLDVGGAAGVYAFWLAERGYTVRLIDATPRLVEVARARNAGAAHPLSACTVGDARALPEADSCADMVLMLGPLYHLVSQADRVRAIGEAARVLRPGGVLIAAAISRWASSLDGLARELFRDAAFAGIVDGDLRDGNHRNPTDRIDFFTTAYFHRPDELRDEVERGGFAVEGLHGIEGPAWILGDLAERWSDPARREIILDVARRLESEPGMVGSSAHLLVVGRKPRA